MEEELKNSTIARYFLGHLVGLPAFLAVMSALRARR
jgi:hypothetical protein